MMSRKVVPAVVGAGAALTLLGAPAFAQAQTHVGTQAVHRKSASCSSPKGQKISISWGDGNVSTTVYFNNHCSQKRVIRLQWSAFHKCITVNPKTKGTKKINDAHGTPNSVTLPKSC